MSKIGVYVCHCGENIAGAVDCKAVREYSESLPGVTVAREYLFMCSDPGQDIIKQDIKAGLVDRVVVAACTPRTHEAIFRKACEEGGINKYLCEMANVRDQDSWAHWHDKDGATLKARRLIRSAVAKANHLEPLMESSGDAIKSVVIVGGGVAGMFSALDLAEMGIKVYLVEKEPSIGGHMIKLDKTFPTMDCSACILTPKMVEVAQHPNIELLSYSEVESVAGHVGDFKVTVKKKARYVDFNTCTGCGVCTEVCPAKVKNDYNYNMDTRKAAYIQFPQAVPKKAQIDSANCLYFKSMAKTGKPACQICQKGIPAKNIAGCPANAINFGQKDEFIDLNVGAILLATGFKPMPKDPFKEYSPQSPNVVTAMEFERIISATGPTEGELKRPSDGNKPKSFAFVSCVGSRDKKHHTYCSKVCCMYMFKEARIVKEKYPDSEIYLFFIDVRTPGKDFDEFHTYCREMGMHVIKGSRVSAIDELPNGNLRVRGFDSDLGQAVEVEVDMAILATAIEPAAGTEEFARKFSLCQGAEGFLKEVHTKLYPVETSTKGVFLAGCIQGPKDIPESISQSRAAASAAAALLIPGKITFDPLISEVNADKCSGCGVCTPLCPYGAISMVGTNGDTRAQIESVLCTGCGVCAATCPSRAITLHGFSTEAVEAQIVTLARRYR
ncbi:MAG TPA: CoB--CoM heterodisulfide reductase iron-sulfur subunit A family protein [Dissulfurispiraceae bacterium]|nr:CoB--CoM heterodisulfide reductase iron-sulfur subunit A family protein [Dissulfurispiraceae bacterium]